MAGLRMICKMYGGMKVNDLTYIWDYVADEPVLEKEIPVGSKRRKASEIKRAELIASSIATVNADSVPLAK